ncbi:MAG: prenyltransferase/squalene oxidase repeat-containing protein [bacterium]|nr:prenyltransferase/squalene oxidase repeat-containing protein [bacterium]
MPTNRSRWVAAFGAAAAVLMTAVVPIRAGINPSTVSYLRSLTPNAWITMALAANGVSDLPTDHLRSVSGSGVNDYAKAILALAALGQNPATFGNVDYIAQLRALAREGQLGDPVFLNDDAWGILALSSASVAADDPLITGATSYLVAHQNGDGGFGFAVGSSSDSNSTAAALLALREAGVAADASAVVSALSYLRGLQNSDGGFPYAASSESDADSTAWVVLALRKLGLDPAASAQPGGTPLSFLASLENPDGSFSWMLSQPGANAFATQDAALALSGATIPVGYYRPANVGAYQYRVEGRDRTICDARLDGSTAYDLLAAGATACGYTFGGTTIEGLGFLLTDINDEHASGFASWMYLVNNVPASVGLQSYQLLPNDDVLVYWDPDYRTPEFPDYDRPLRLGLSSTAVASGGPVTATVTVFRDGAWLPLGGAAISGTPSPVTTASDGTVLLSLPDGRYTLQASKTDYVRSAPQAVSVGDGVSGTTQLKVEVVEGDGGVGGTVGGSSIVFSVSPAQLDLGRLTPGQRAAGDVTLNNDGTVDVAVTAEVSGDSLFTALLLGGVAWPQFSANVLHLHSLPLTVELTVPGGYLGRGIKTGELIFWADPQ